MFRKTLWLGAVFAAGLASVATAGPVRDVVKLTNDYRAQFGLPPLMISSALEGVAQSHGDDMGRHRYFSHTSRDGSDIGDRALRGGYRYCVIAENIAQGHRSSREVTRGWIDSPGHRANMLSDDVAEIGVTRGRGDIWVMVLGSRQC